ncbi:MAG: heparan-alpha-glucosaminide N-acetyltransferase domain-containing protein [Ectothiorhodospiraceae bacterium]
MQTAMWYLRQRPSLSPAQARVDAIDLARGMAVALMILSHGVKGLLDFDQFPDWGLVPIHALTKFSSTLFILVFGVALGVAFLSHVGSADWPQRRLKLLINGVRVFFWYKVLTVVEMLQVREPEAILDTLLYADFPSYVEILGFYAIALLWIPFFLPLWARMPLGLRLALPVITAWIAVMLPSWLDFSAMPTVQALLVEHEDYYTWGQLSRAPIVFCGLLLGELIRVVYDTPRLRRKLGMALVVVGGLLFSVFFSIVYPEFTDTLRSLALNEGKHPPEFVFTLYSSAGAAVLMGIALFGGPLLAKVLRPVTIIGSDALSAFIFHITVIFIGFRFLLGYWKSIDYETALILAVALIFATAIWIRVNQWLKAHS